MSFTRMTDSFLNNLQNWGAGKIVGVSRLKVPPHGVPRHQLNKFNPPSRVHYFKLHHLVSQSPPHKISKKTQFH